MLVDILVCPAYGVKIVASNINCSEFLLISREWYNVPIEKVITYNHEINLQLKISLE